MAFGSAPFSFSLEKLSDEKILHSERCAPHPGRCEDPCSYCYRLAPQLIAYFRSSSTIPCEMVGVIGLKHFVDVGFVLRARFCPFCRLYPWRMPSPGGRSAGNSCSDQ